jgi:twinkle protein
VATIIVPDEIDLSAFEAEEGGAKVRPASYWADKVIERMYPPAGSTLAGACLPWGKTHGNIRLRPGEVSLWPGINGHGKSILTSHVALSLCCHGERVLIASMEMKPEATLARMSRQLSGHQDPAIKMIRSFLSWSDDRLWLYDQLGTVHPMRMAAVVRYGIEKLGITHFFIDSLMKVVHAEDDYNAQKSFVDNLCVIARDNGVHVHLIHHSKKLSDEFSPPGKFDAKGTGAITDLVDNVFTTWRNKRKEEKVARGDAVDKGEPDAMVICDKQRHGEWEGRIALWYHKESMQYLPQPASLPAQYSQLMDSGSEAPAVIEGVEL